jgi:hypothetical protein
MFMNSLHVLPQMLVDTDGHGYIYIPSHNAVDALNAYGTTDMQSLPSVTINP